MDFGLEIEPMEVLEAGEDEFEHGRYVVRYRIEKTAHKDRQELH